MPTSGISQLFNAGIPVCVPKLMKIILEKISLVQILGDKIFIGIVCTRCEKFNLTISLFF